MVVCGIIETRMTGRPFFANSVVRLVNRNIEFLRLAKRTLVRFCNQPVNLRLCLGVFVNSSDRDSLFHKSCANQNPILRKLMILFLESLSFVRLPIEKISLPSGCFRKKGFFWEGFFM